MLWKASFSLRRRQPWLGVGETSRNPPGLAVLWQDMLRFDRFDPSTAEPVSQSTIRDYFVSPARTQVRAAMSLSTLRARARELCRSGNWTDLQQDRELCDYLAHHCLECGRWRARSRELVVHLREAHSTCLDPWDYCSVTTSEHHHVPFVNLRGRNNMDVPSCCSLLSCRMPMLVLARVMAQPLGRSPQLNLTWDQPHGHVTSVLTISSRGLN